MESELREIERNRYDLRQCSLPVVAAASSNEFGDEEALYRAYVLRYNRDQQKAFVKFIDWGNSEWVPSHHVFYIPAKFSILSCAAIRLALTHSGDRKLPPNYFTCPENMPKFKAIIEKAKKKKVTVLIKVLQVAINTLECFDSVEFEIISRIMVSKMQTGRTVRV